MASDREIGDWERVADSMVAIIHKESSAAVAAKNRGDEAARRGHSALAQAATQRFMRHMKKRPAGAKVPKIK